MWRSLDEIPADAGPAAVTIGKFDGVHLGHRAVIDRVREVARDRSLVPTVVTFDRNPLSVLRPELCPGPLVSNEQKLELLAEAGVEATLMLTFDEEFRAMAPESFVVDVLVRGLHSSAVLVGGDFRFGARGAGDVGLLRALGGVHDFEVILVDDVANEADRRVSSTWIREALDAGDVRTAARLLGGLPSIRAEVVHGFQRGRTLGYPTANLSSDIEGFVPADGVYATWLVIDGVRYGSATSIGNNPTFEGVPEKQVESHAFDQSFDLYGRRVEVEFVEFVRGMRKFSGAQELAAQMARDEDRVREILGMPPHVRP
jgi:riboflavin kinase/FMN adenylyltransferase